MRQDKTTQVDKYVRFVTVKWTNHWGYRISYNETREEQKPQHDQSQEQSSLLLLNLSLLALTL
jgi:hypothetical protein